MLIVDLAKQGIESWKRELDKADDEDKIFQIILTIFGGLIGLLVLIGVVALLVALIKFLLPVAVLFTLVWGATVRWMDVPAPPLAKKIFNYRKQS